MIDMTVEKAADILDEMACDVFNHGENTEGDPCPCTLCEHGVVIANARDNAPDDLLWQAAFWLSLSGIATAIVEMDADDIRRALADDEGYWTVSLREVYEEKYGRSSVG